MTPHTQNEWEKEAAKTATEAIKLTKHYSEFSERIFQGFKKADATTKRATIQECMEVLPSLRPRDYYHLSGSQYREGEHDGFNEAVDEIRTALEKLLTK